MIKLTWYNEPVKKDMQIKQVYGLVFDECGRILLRIYHRKGKGIYCLAGGHPEKFDKDIEDTLRREMIEEVNTTLQQKVVYIGYQEVDDPNEQPCYAQVRMIAKIDKIGPKQPDPDNGETYDRVLVTPKKAIEYLNWGEVGRKMIERAVELATTELGVVVDEQAEDKWV